MGQGRDDALPRAGWFDDPVGSAGLRYWTGTVWSGWVSDGQAVWLEPQPRRALGPQDLEHLAFVEDLFLPEAVSRQVMSADLASALATLVEQLRTEARPVPTPAAAPTSAAARAPAPVEPGAVEPTQALSEPLQAAAPHASPAEAQPVAVVPAEPGPVARWWARSREAIGSDLAVHGLAYLGVLLFFVGAFGLVVFAFGNVARGLRPVAEVVIALVPFATGALLRRRGAVVVGRALEALGGLLLPVIAITTLVDGFGFPPDPRGTALVVGATASTALITVAYAAWTRRDANSALRHVVAPAAWLTVAMATLGLAREVPTGKGIATPSAVQAAAIVTALAGSLLWARLRPRARLAGPTLTAAVAGLPIAALMALLSAAAEGWPTVPVLVSGVGVLVALQLLRGWLPSVVVSVAGPLWWAVVWAALAAGTLPAAVGAAVAVVGFVVLLELADPAHAKAEDVEPAAAEGVDLPEGATDARATADDLDPSDLALVLAALGASAAMLATWSDARWASAVLGLAAVWAAVRRAAPFATSRGAATPGVLLDLAAGLLPALALASLARATNPPVAVVTAAAVVAAVTALALRPWLRREPGDLYWLRWWQLAVPAVALASLVVWQPTLITGEKWATTASFALLTAASTIGPVPRLWRPLVVAVLGLATWLSMAATMGLADPVRIALPAFAGLGLVVLVHLPPWRSLVEVGSIALTGHGLGAVAVGMALSTVPATAGFVVLPTGQLGWALVGALATATAGVIVTGWCDSVGRSPVGPLLAGEGWSLRWVPLALAATGLPVTVSALLAVTGALPLAHPWAIAIPAVAAVAYAAATRASLPARVVSTLAWGGFVSGLVASVGPFLAGPLGLQPGTAAGQAPTLFGLSLADRSPAIAGLSSLVIAVLLLRPDRRDPAMTWTAWSAGFPLTGLVVAQLSPAFAALPGATATALTLVTVGGVLLVGGAAADLRDRAWAPRSSPAHRGLVPPVCIGTVGIVLALATALAALPPRPAGWVTLIAAVAVLATALCSRAGALAGAAAVLGWITALLLAGPAIAARPWLATLSALAILLAAQGFSASKRWAPAAPRWARWDVPLLLAAAPVGASGPILAAGGAWSGAMFAAVGAEALAVAVRLRRTPIAAVPVGVLGAGLLLTGAASEGSGWLALALLGLALLTSGLALLVQAPSRSALQVVGAVCAVGSWRALTHWLGWPDQQSVDVAALWAAGLAAGLAAVARFGQPASSAAQAASVGDTGTTGAGNVGDTGTTGAGNVGLHDPTEPGRSWLLTWGGAAVAVVSITAWDALTTASVLRSAVGPSWWITASVGTTAAALAIAARPLRVATLRDLASIYGLVALAVGARAAHLSPAQRVLVLVLVSAVAAALLLVRSTSEAVPGPDPRRASPGASAQVWLRSLIVLGAGSALWSVGTAALASTPVAISSTALHGPVLLVGPLVAVALQCAAIGVALRQFWLQALAAPVLCVAWLVFADAALAIHPQWATVPIGLTTLVVVALWRRDRQRRGERLDVVELVVPELLGIAFLVGAFFVEAVSHSLWQAVVAAAVGVAVIAWGVITRVRRRLVAGSVIAAAGLFIPVAVPLVRLLPSWEGAALWVLIAGLGLVAVGAASLMERGKVVTRKGVARFGTLTAGWE
jgi:hypothetical protein